MIPENSALKSRAAFASTFLALASVGLALSSLLVASVAIKVVMLVVAVLLIGAAGASLAVVIARPKPPRDR
ncbi:hypothetical protein [Cryobacterium luteum]|uniref:Uncharacterized protein n=1 Tax=Cryobacterium luteum TaxID=1424661 RepID=A0A1H8LV46_9MICO|nr:hypothetical protein [Cryobacterium luteum]TFB84244.1 hypothetical protein E3O10_16410 [Cryobacterium luteum]SEO08900.1 hypothetical protein SAMN05216281_1328 [Cryobacterium luteum]